MLLTFGADINAQDKRGVKAWQEMRRNDLGSLPNLLKQFGANCCAEGLVISTNEWVKPEPINDNSPLINACLNDVTYRLFVRKILRHGSVSVNECTSKSNSNALHILCDYALYKRDYMLEPQKYDMWRNCSKNTVLDLKDDIMEVLIEAGTDVRARDNAGCTPLDRLLFAMHNASRSERIRTYEMQLTYRIAFMFITSLVKAGSPVHSVLMNGDNVASTHCNTLLTHVVYAAQSVFYFFWYNTAPTEESRIWMDYFLELIRLLTTVLGCQASQEDCDVVNAILYTIR